MLQQLLIFVLDSHKEALIRIQLPKSAPISNEDQVVTLLGSPSQSYSTLVTALEARGDDLTSCFVQQALIQEEQKRKGVMPEDSRSTALVGSAHRTKRKKN